MTTIEVNGQQVQAYDLIMRKEHALEIIAGRKPLEIRAFSDHYCRMFDDKAQQTKNEKLRKEGREDECIDPIRTDIAYVHFHNYNNSWSLDVAIDEIGCEKMDQEGVEFLATEFGFHDYDNEWRQYVGKPDDEVPMFFWIHIDEVVNRVGI
jgi:hypothetical protein